MRPTDDLERVADATDRFLRTARGLSEPEITRPSLLPGWTVGHVLVHVARNADSHVRRAEAAVRNEVVEQYPGGYAGRAADIEAGTSRPSAAILEDLSGSCAALAEMWSRVPEEAWGRSTRDVGGRERPLSALPGRRWQELEVHRIDLGAGVTYHDWPDDFVAAWLPRLEASVPERVATGHRVPAADRLDDRLRLAWLYGRARPPDFPELAPWA